MTDEFHSVEFWAVDRDPRDPTAGQGTVTQLAPVVLSVHDDEPLLDVRARGVAAVELKDGDLWVEVLLAHESEGTPDLSKVLDLWEPFGIRNDGSAIHAWASLGNFTFGDLRRGVDAGFIPGRWNRILLRPRGGRGGGGPVVDIVQFLSDAGVDWISGSVIGSALTFATFGFLPRRLKKVVAVRAARRVAAQWRDSHLDSPWDLRAFFNLKSLWKQSEVSRLLRVSPALASEILLATGHARRKGTEQWVLGGSPQSLERKQKFDSLSESTYS